VSKSNSASSKHLFLGLAVLSLLSLVTLTYLFWLFISPRVNEISHALAFICYQSLRVFYLLIGFGILMILATSYLEKNFLILGQVIRLTIQFLFPVTVWLGRLFGITKERVRESYVHVNNIFVKTRSKRYKAKDILILLPHCLQRTDCTIRITNDINHCAQCGRCDIAALLDLSRKYGVGMVIATGGTLARKLIVERRPKFILAVACQRDLVSGIQDAFPIPSYGVLNLRPEGPCQNTRVVVEQIEEALLAVLDRDVHTIS
jgi:hypothetical protein